MKSLSQTILTFIFGVLTLLTSQVASYTLTGNILTDLTANDASFFDEAVGWQASSLAISSAITSMCGDTFLIGGAGVLGPYNSNQYGQRFYRTYSSLPAHNVFYYSLSFWVIDGWIEGVDYVHLYFDSYYAGRFTFSPTYTVSPNYCGATARNEIPNVKFEGRVSHSSTSALEFSLYSYINGNSNTSSFGFRDIQLTFDSVGSPSNIAPCARSPTYYAGARCGCAAGSYESPSNTGSCATCHSNCLTCYDGNSNNCQSCSPGKYLTSNQCVTCHSTCVTCNGAGSSACASCAEGYYLSGGQCLQCDSTCKTCVVTATRCTSCPDGRYQSGNTCPQCHSSCTTCDGGSSTNCLTCPSNSFMVPNQKSCVTTCTSPLTQTTENSINYCTTPCASDMTKFVYWDRSCQSTCASPLSQVTNGPIKLCNYLCTNSNEYLYWNTICNTTCPSPLKVDVRFQKAFCVFPCTSSQFLYEDGTCQDTCPFPLRTRTPSAGMSYCEYPCSTGEYLLWDQTCIPEANCTAPYVKVEENNARFRYCNFPCESASQYHYWNGTCSYTACSSTFTLRQVGTAPHIRNFCDLDCEEGQYLLWYGGCGNNCDAPYRLAESNGLTICKAPCDSAFPVYFEDLAACGKECIAPRVLNNSRIYPVCDKAPVVDQGGSLVYFLMNAPQVNEYSLLVPTPNMKFLKYMDVKLPSRLQKLSDTQGKFLFSPRFGLSAPSSLRRNTRRLLLAEVFEKSGLDTNFIVNFWDGLLTLAIILAITLALTILENFLQNTKLKLLHGIVERLMVMGGFNYFLLVYASCIGEIIMYTYIELAHFSGVSAGLIVGILLTLMIIPFFGGIVFVIKRATKFGAYNLKNETADKYKKFSIRWRACQIFFRGMNADSMVKKLFFLIYTARTTLQMLVAVFLYSIPIAQVIIQILINVLMIIFMLIKKPLQKRVNHIQIVLFESITLLLNFCLFIVVIMSSSDNQDSGFAVVLGDIIVIGTDALNMLVLIFIAIKVRLEVLSILKLLKEYPNHNKAVWINLLGVLAQMTGMGFEEVIEESSIPTSANKYIGLLLKTKSASAEKLALLKSKSQVYPDDFTRKSINDTDPITKKNETPNISINGERPENSELFTNAELTQNQPLSPPKLQSRVKNAINNISLKKQGTDMNLNASPTFSIDLSDNSPTIQDNVLLLKQGSILESPIATANGGNDRIFFPTDITAKSSRPTSNYDDKRLFNLTPILPPVIENTIEEKKPPKIADEVGLDDYLKQFGLLSEDTNKASSTVNRKNLSRSPTLKSKKK